MKGLVGSALERPDAIPEEAAGPQGAPRAAGDGYSDSEHRALPPGETDPDLGGDAAAGVSADPGGAEEDDAQYELDLEKVMTAAARAMQTPDMEDSLRELKQAPDLAQGIADLAMSVIDGLDQASGATIPEDVLPGATLGIAAMIGDVIDADSASVTMAAQKLVLSAMQQDGMNPEEMQQALARADFSGMVEKAAQQLGGSDGA